MMMKLMMMMVMQLGTLWNFIMGLMERINYALTTAYSSGFQCNGDIIIDKLSG